MNLRYAKNLEADQMAFQVCSRDVVLSFLPARIIEICRPLLNAWLKSKRVWNSDTNGNHDKMAMGMKIMSPII